jgi:hypothetical protein
MIWQRIDTAISFDDPESGFEFRTVDALIELAFRDWRNRVVRFEFASVFHFRFSFLCELADFPGPGFYTIQDSPLIPALRESLAMGSNEPANHYVVATNEDQWCDIVAQSYHLAIDDIADGR